MKKFISADNQIVKQEGLCGWSLTYRMIKAKRMCSSSYDEVRSISEAKKLLYLSRLNS